MELINTYACYLKNEDIRIHSSSGAVFSAIASYVLAKNGIVYGVAMSEDCYSAEYISVTDEKELAKLRGSKYLQAKMGDTYKHVRADLQNERLVLFTGTGCQIIGLKLFLGRDYSNLICVDVICHGVPSPALWKKYVLYQEQKHRGKMKCAYFRCKDLGWTNFGMKEVIMTKPKSELREIFLSKDIDAYLQMFLKDYCLRPSCYECPAKKIKLADITIADFWGIQNVSPDLNDEKGTSLVLIRTRKGKNIFDEIIDNFEYREVSYDEGVRNNKAEYQSAKRPIQRDYFFLDMKKMSFEKLKKIYAAPARIPIKKRVKRTIKRGVMLAFGIIGKMVQRKDRNGE